LAGTVISLCCDYRSGVKHAPRDVVRVIDEVNGLKVVLEQLFKAAESQIAKGCSRLPTLELLSKPDGPLMKCQAELATLKAELELVSWMEGSRQRADLAVEGSGCEEGPR